MMIYKLHLPVEERQQAEVTWKVQNTSNSKMIVWVWDMLLLNMQIWLGLTS